MKSNNNKSKFWGNKSEKGKRNKSKESMRKIKRLKL